MPWFKSRRQDKSSDDDPWNTLFQGDLDVRYYEHGHVPMDWNGVMNSIERNQYTAIVHDRKEHRLEHWLDGRMLSGVGSHLIAEQQTLLEDLETHGAVERFPRFVRSTRTQDYQWVERALIVSLAYSATGSSHEVARNLLTQSRLASTACISPESWAAYYRHTCDLMFEFVGSAPSGFSPAILKEAYGLAFWYGARHDHVVSQLALDSGDVARACSSYLYASRRARDAAGWYQQAPCVGIARSMEYYGQQLYQRRQQVHPLHQGQSCTT